ncbi:major facilitator superfamily domain-containing protein [Umbelopsis sp. PMI_123]|nr:major facilitator superfamily domain-containing protein [Umbelopsis sp. PMI_123]
MSASPDNASRRSSRSAVVDPIVQRRNARRRVLTFIGLQLTLFLAALDGTIVSTAMPTIGSEFNQMSIVAWVATAYILTFDAFQPLFSKFSDICGRKVILLLGTGIFLFGSILSGASTSIIMLIVSRAISGIGGSAILSMVFVIISELVPLEQRGKYQGIVNAVFAISSVFGPLIGGSFTDHVTWRWNFYINLPIGAIAMAIIFFFLDSPIPSGTIKEKLKRVDYIGTMIVLSFATLFLLAMNFGGQTFPWKSAAVIVPLVLTFILIAMLCVVESRYAKEPIMPPRLFKNRSVVAIMVTNFFFGCSFFAMVYYLPVYLQIIRGDSATQSGLRLIPMQMVLCTLSTSVGWLISRFGQWKPFLHFGTAILVTGIGLLSLLDNVCSWSLIYGLTSFCGLGLGCLYGSALIGFQASAEPRDIAVVTGLCNFSRILGGALGVAISSAIINSSLTQSLPQHMPSQYAFNIIDSSLYVRDGLPAQYFEVTIECYVQAMKLLWCVMTAFAGVGFLASWFIKHSSLRRDEPKATVVVCENKNEKAVGISESKKEESAGVEQHSTQVSDVVIEVHDDASESAPKN